MGNSETVACFSQEAVEYSKETFKIQDVTPSLYMFTKKNLHSETKRLQKELIEHGYDFKQLLGGCHKPRDNYLDIAETFTKFFGKKYHWYNIKKIIRGASSILQINNTLTESSIQTERRHKIILEIINQFENPNIGHAKFQITYNLKNELNIFDNNFEEIIQYACSCSLSRSIFHHIEADDTFMYVIYNLWEKTANPLTKKELFSCLIGFNHVEEVYNAKLNNDPENKYFVKSFLEYDERFLSYESTYCSEIKDREKLIQKIEQLDCEGNTEQRKFAKEKITELEDTIVYLSDLSVILGELTTNIFINPRVMNINPKYIDKKYWTRTVETLIDCIERNSLPNLQNEIYRMLGESWYSRNNKLRYAAINILLEKIEIDKAENMKGVGVIGANECIGKSIESLIRPSSKKDKELYFETLRKIVENDNFGDSRYYFLKPLARLGKDEVFQTLIKLMNGPDNTLKQSALEEIRRLKPKEAKPYLEKFIGQFGKEYDFHKEIAQTALRGIIKKHF